MILITSLFFFFFFNDTATTEIYTLSLHDALPISLDWASSEKLSGLCSSGQAEFAKSWAGWKQTGPTWSRKAEVSSGTSRTRRGTRTPGRALLPASGSISQTEYNHDLLSRIPSPSRRLWVGLWIILSIFVAFALYAVHEVRWLEDFQVNVVQRNRKASLQLLRLQNNAYALAISLREMTESPARYKISDWRAGFVRLRQDMEDAANLERQYAVEVRAADDKRGQFRGPLPDFWRATHHALAVADAGPRA